MAAGTLGILRPAGCHVAGQGDRLRRGAILSVVAASVLWGRDGAAMRRLRFPAGWIVSTALALAWPTAMMVRHGWGALALWTLHVTDRLAAHPGEFAGEPWWQYHAGPALPGDAVDAPGPDRRLALAATGALPH